MSCGSTHFACDCMRARIAVLESALKLCERELTFMLGASPERRGGLYEQARDAARQALQGESSKGGNADLLAAVSNAYYACADWLEATQKEHGHEPGWQKCKKRLKPLSRFLEPSPAEQEGGPTYTCPSCRYPRTASNCDVCAGGVKS